MSNDIICNGNAANLPSLNVVKTPIKYEMDPAGNFDWLLHIYYARQDFSSCEALIDQLLDTQLNPEYLYFVRGQIRRNQEKYYEALKYFQLAINLNSKNIENFKEIGKTLYLMGRYEQALEVYREAEELSNRPDNEIFHFIGEILLLSDNPNSRQEAKQYFQKAVEHGKMIDSFKRLAELHRQEKDYSKAVEVLEACLQISPESTEILTEISVLYLKINETQKAFDKLLNVTDINAGCPLGLLAFGAILQSRGDVDGALAKYKQIHGCDNVETSELWNNVGLCFFKKKKNFVAISCLRKSVWLAPLNYNALYNMSLIYITAKQYASGFHTLAAAISLRKESAECYMLLGICLQKLKDNENALLAFERSSGLVKPNMKSPLVFLNSAIFLYQMGKTEAAAVNFNNFVEESKEFVLSTELKFQATKLKAMLQQSNCESLVESLGRLDEENENEKDNLPLEVTAKVMVTPQKLNN
ncbi:BBS4 family protein [Megaselia abdita]